MSQGKKQVVIFLIKMEELIFGHVGFSFINVPVGVAMLALMWALEN